MIVSVFERRSCPLYLCLILSETKRKRLQIKMNIRFKL